jgi:hypothetical protein
MKTILISFIAIAVIAITGCDNLDLLQSEKKLNTSIQKTWRIVTSKAAPNDKAAEKWTFKDNVINIAFKKSNAVDTLVIGSYSLDSRISKAYVNVSAFNYSAYTNSSFTADDLNRQWSIVELDNGIMYLSATDTKGAIRSLEFIEE